MDKFSSKVMQDIKSDLDDLLNQEPPVKSNEQLIGKFVNEMRSALDKGWSIEDLIGILKKHGIEIQANTLRSYIQRQKNKGGSVDSGFASSTADTPAAAANGEKPKRKRGKKKEEEKPVNQQPLIESASTDGSFKLDSDEV